MHRAFASGSETTLKSSRTWRFHTYPHVNLSTFISKNIEQILSEWDNFAQTLFTDSASPVILRDHAREILEELMTDIDTPQTGAQQIEKSQGLAPQDADQGSAASVHGTQRHANGISLVQLASEYRALRATVFRLWLPHMESSTAKIVDDITRFNEAIDQALAQSILTYSENSNRVRDTFLAILGHDLRSPLFTISMAGRYFKKLQVVSRGSQQMGERVERGAASMTGMINDLLEYARTQLGGPIPLTLRRTDVQDVCLAAVEDAQAGHPDCAFELEAEGMLMGSFDGPRLQQVFSNLLNNAAQYRGAGQPVKLSIIEDGSKVVVQVRNRGPVTPAASLKAIFDPLVQLSVTEGEQKGAPTSSLGLGLFIAREITTAHGGTITAESSKEAGTVFTVRLPREFPAELPAPNFG